MTDAVRLTYSLSDILKDFTLAPLLNWVESDGVGGRGLVIVASSNLWQQQNDAITLITPAMLAGTFGFRPAPGPTPTLTSSGKPDLTGVHIQSASPKSAAYTFSIV